MTSTPSYDTPQQTPPTLLAAAAQPALTQPIIIVPANVTMNPTFGASVLSEDAGEPVLLQLLVDYGDLNKAGNPYQHSGTTSGQVDPGSLSDGPRPTGNIPLDPILLTTPDNMTVCHTVTMLATHKFAGESGCPVCITDSSMLTWLVVACPATDGTSCEPFTLANDNCGLLTDSWTAGCPVEADDAGTCPFQSVKGMGQ